MIHKCRICKTNLWKDYGVYRNMDNEERYYCYSCFKRHYVYCRENPVIFSSVIAS